jgi:altronate hydrolase
LNSQDNVATVTDSVAKGEIVALLSDEGKNFAQIAATTAIPLPLHKIALTSIANDGEVRKYGEIIGYASSSIDKGAWVHTHNVESANLPEKKNA